MDQEEREMLDELFKAAERLGKNPDECMRWVLKFAQADLANYSDGQWTDLCAEVDVFTSRGPLIRTGRGFVHLGAAFDWSGPPPEEALPKGKWVAFTFHPSRKQVTALQEHTKEILEAFAQNEEIKLVLGPLHIYLEPWRAFRSGGLSFKTHTPADAFGFHLTLLLSHYHGRVRSCKACSTMFLADRRNQQYCTTRCLSRVTQRRWRERHMKKKPSKAIKGKKQQPSAKGGGHGTKGRS